MARFDECQEQVRAGNIAGQRFGERRLQPRGGELHHLAQVVEVLAVRISR